MIHWLFLFIEVLVQQLSVSCKFVREKIFLIFIPLIKWLFYQCLLSYFAENCIVWFVIRVWWRWISMATSTPTIFPSLLLLPIFSFFLMLLFLLIFLLLSSFISVTIKLPEKRSQLVPRSHFDQWVITKSCNILTFATSWNIQVLPLVKPISLLKESKCTKNILSSNPIYICSTWLNAEMKTWFSGFLRLWLVPFTSLLLYKTVCQFKDPLYIIW